MLRFVEAKVSKKLNLPAGKIYKIAVDAFTRAVKSRKAIATVYAELADRFENEYGMSENSFISLLDRAASDVRKAYNYED
jgi:hypothetical protein